jgi:hypothetical protein
MPTVTHRSGVRVELPSWLEIDETAAAAATSSPRRRPSSSAYPSGPVPMPSTSAAAPDAASDAVADAFATQDMQLVATLPLRAKAQPPRRRPSRASAAPTLPLALDVAANEDAVVLLEQDGFYAWNFPASVEETPAQPQRRDRPARPASRHVRFEIDIATAPPATRTRRGARRDWLEDLVIGQVKAFVFKFAARVGVAAAMKYLERDVQTGLVVMEGTDPERWGRADDLRALALPQDRAPRVLLFVHGTFSTTRGSFGALGLTPDGKALLERMRANYDAIIGYDHPTLSVTPLENATDLLARLERFGGQFAPTVDVIAYSRGGLVFRSLAEYLLPVRRWDGRIDRAIFVAVPNDGTRLAMSKNWRVLVDLYTNLAVTATRALGLIPQAQPAAFILREMVQGLGALVKYSVSYATEEDGVPGIAAMVPGGAFINGINGRQPNQPGGENTYYCAVTSEFEVGNLLDGAPAEWAKRFINALVDLNVDSLMGEANDLVVNTASMTAIDLDLGAFVKDTLPITAQSLIYHLNYFVQPNVLAAFGRWLRLAPSPDTADWDALALRLPPDLVEPGVIVMPELPALVDPSFIVADAQQPAQEAIQALATYVPRYVVVQRRHEGRMLSYAYTAQEVWEAATYADTALPLIDFLNMHEYEASQHRRLTDPMSLGTPNRGAPSNRGVVFDGERPVGVLPAFQEPSYPATSVPPPIDIEENIGGGVRGLGDPWNTSQQRHQSARDNLWSPAPLPMAPPPLETVPPEAITSVEPPATVEPSAPSLPTPSSPEPVVAVPEPEEPLFVTCHFMAEMDGEIVTGKESTIEVHVSRDTIERIVGRVSGSGSATVATDRKMLIQVIAKARVEIVGDDRVEADAPPPGEPQTYYFDVRGVESGEGEVWIVARQGQVPLVTIKLKMRVVAAKGRGATRVSAQATTVEPPALEQPLHQLRIYEREVGGDKVYQFELHSPELKLLNTYESPRIMGDRNAYVAGLYAKIEDRWLSSQNDIDNFTDELRAFGGELCDELLPSELQAVLWKHRAKIKNIQVISAEPFIPWELVCLKQPGKAMSSKARFLGQMGMVRWPNDGGWPPTQLRVREGRARHVIPRYPHPDYKLPEAEQEAAFLEQHFKSTEVEPQVGPVRKLLSQGGAFDLLHFACHGGAEQDNISNAHILMEGRVENGQYLPAPLDAGVVRQWSDLVGAGNQRPIVVLNACQIGRAGYQLTGIGGFADAFLVRGAGAFVGTLWAVGDYPARSFTEAFYAELLEGKTVADATVAAREAARKAGDATWLAYVVYAHPHARLVR